MDHIDGAVPPELVADRNRAVAALDITWARRMFPGAPDADVLAALHKARYHMAAMPPALRVESARWMRDHGLKDALGLEPSLDLAPTWG